MLVHPAPELATGRDAIISAASASTPYGIVAQTDLCAAVRVSQLGRRVGHLSEQMIAHIQAAVDQSDTEIASATAHQIVRTGAPLRGPADRRWQFKESEGVALRTLAIWPE